MVMHLKKYFYESCLFRLNKNVNNDKTVAEASNLTTKHAVSTK